MFMHPTQTVKLFGNSFTSRNILGILVVFIKILEINSKGFYTIVQVKWKGGSWKLFFDQCLALLLNGGLSRLHSADEDAVSWLTNYGKWHAYEKKKIIIIIIIIIIINDNIYPAVSKASRTGNKVSCQPNDCPNRWVFKRRLKMASDGEKQYKIWS